MLEERVAAEVALEAERAVALAALVAEREAAADERSRFGAALSDQLRASAEREDALKAELVEVREASADLRGSVAEQEEKTLASQVRLEAALERVSELDARLRLAEGRRVLQRLLRALWQGR